MTRRATKRGRRRRWGRVSCRTASGLLQGRDMRGFHREIDGIPNLLGRPRQSHLGSDGCPLPIWTATRRGDAGHPPHGQETRRKKEELTAAAAAAGSIPAATRPIRRQQQRLGTVSSDMRATAATVRPQPILHDRAPTP